ncbi:hypothetical protein, partial [Bifidobacterium pullorum]|uniref:hypothetical protein n=1 Tax=Bifidobacterium pullorum TaxID=78448 RepID=UPI00195863A6
MFFFIEKDLIVKLYKDIDLLKMVYIYPLYSLNELESMKISLPNSFSLNQITGEGDQIIKEKFEAKLNN